MGKLKASLERYNELLEVNKQDIIRVCKLAQESLDGLKLVYWEFTEALFEEYRQVSSVVWEKFLRVLGVEEDRAVSFNEIKNRMSAFQATGIDTGEADELFLIYNNRESLRRVESAGLLLDWMAYALECKVYRQKTEALKRNQPKVLGKIQNRLERISKLSKTLETVQQNLADLDQYLKFQRISLETSSPSSSAGSLKCPSGSVSDSGSKTMRKIENFSEVQVSTNDYYREPTVLRSFQRIPYLFEREQELRCCKNKFFCC